MKDFIDDLILNEFSKEAKKNIKCTQCVNNFKTKLSNNIKHEKRLAPTSLKRKHRPEQQEIDKSE
jgi:hypothetical protein